MSRKTEAKKLIETYDEKLEANEENGDELVSIIEFVREIAGE